MAWWIPLAAMAAGAAAGANKADNQNRMVGPRRKYEEGKARVSPWTHQQGQPVENADFFGEMLAGGLGGLGLAQKYGDMVDQFGGGGEAETLSRAPESERLQQAPPPTTQFRTPEQVKSIALTSPQSEEAWRARQGFDIDRRRSPYERIG